MITTLSSLLCLLTQVLAVDYNPDDLSSMQDSTSEVVKGMLDYYPAGSSDESTRSGATVGMFQEPYYWWEAGVAFGVLIDYQYLLEESNYTSMIKAALLHQAGDSYEFMPSNQSLVEGNDDQGFWGLTVMTAAERNFSNPGDDEPGWLYSAEAVYKDMKDRWDTKECGGGLRWQIYTWNSGYDYKNTVSNGCLFNLAARLARYTGNSTYADTAKEVWDWMSDTELIDTSGDSFAVYDGASTSDSCSKVTENQWTYNSGLLLSGAAYMYAYSNGSSEWQTRAKNIWSHGSSVFFEDNVVRELCQDSKKCNNDQRCFKGIYLQQLSQTAVLVPDLQDDIMTAINASAKAAAQSCSGGRDGHTCGMNWNQGSYDDMYGLGEQINAVSAFTSSLVLSKDGPYTAHNGGSSNDTATKGISSGSGSNTNPLEDDRPVTTGDRAGAGIVTAILMIFLIGVGIWIIL